jgi:membrane-associated phospholipid phosphatase
MHVAFALMIAVPALYVIRNRVIRTFFAVYPLLVTITVVVTGNHWWLDAFLGALVAAVSALAASGALARARPDAWAFRTGFREAPV